MSLNIKNDETCRLVGELAKLTGETMTGAVTVASRERLAREQCARDAQRRLGEMRTIAERCARLPGPGPSAIGHGAGSATGGACPGDHRFFEPARNPVSQA